jgi:dTDP-4-dehydrorhamnose 3,5-epimerase
MKTYGKKLPGLKVIERKLFTDDRGYFSETYRSNLDEMTGLYRQLNTAKSTKGVLRGLHRQNQTKLVMPVDGTIFDVAVDVDTGDWFGIILDETNGLLIPPQYAHGYLVLSETSIVQYIVDKPYDKTKESNFKWNNYGIEWPLDGSEPILSEKDK